jgi:hypothetical protein
MRLLLPSLLWLLMAGAAHAQQVADPDADLGVPKPAFTPSGPRVAIDGGHHNFHTLAGRYAPFAQVLRNDGLTVEASNGRLTSTSLAGVRILVIANPLDTINANGNWSLPTPSAFTRDEIAAVVRFVTSGGSLLLIADHMPFAGAAHDLAAAFGVTLENGFAFSELPGKSRTPPPDLFTRENGGLVDDPIVRNVRQVRTFTGSAFTASGRGVRPVLRLGPRWTVLEPVVAWQFDSTTRSSSGEGKLQGALVTAGRGRVAVFGEAAMFTAQVAGPGRIPMGLGAPGAEENKRFALDIVHWLAGLIP